MDDAVADDARGLLATGRTGTLHYGPDGQRRGEGMAVFVNSFEPPPRLLVFGAIDFAAAMARMGAYLGYRVTVCDARPVFATSSRFPDAHEVVVDWPHRYLAAEVEAGRVDERTVVTVLTHDPKFDVPVLEVALRAKLGYVGAMGSRRTHDDRMRRLREAGLDRGRAGPARLADRPRPRCPHPGGDRRVDRRGDHLAALGRRGQAPRRHRRQDPPRPGRGRRALTGFDTPVAGHHARKARPVPA